MNIFSPRYKHQYLLNLKNGTRHLKEHPKLSKFFKCDGDQFKPKGKVHLVRIGGTGDLQPILSPLILKVYYAFAFKPITIKFDKFTNIWMLFQMTCPIFNSTDTEHSYQDKNMFVPSPLFVQNMANTIDVISHTKTSREFSRASLLTPKSPWFFILQKLSTTVCSDPRVLNNVQRATKIEKVALSPDVV